MVLAGSQDAVQIKAELEGYGSQDGPYLGFYFVSFCVFRGKDRIGCDRGASFYSHDSAGKKISRIGGQQVLDTHGAICKFQRMREAVIRKCEPGDEGTLSLIGQATFLESFAGILPGKDIILHCAKQHAVEKYAAWLHGPAATTWLVEIEPKQAPVGYLVLTTPDLPLADISSSDAEIKRIYLLHRFQGAGIGARLMEHARSHALAHHVRRLLLGVYAHNREAIHFYEKLGYRAVGQRQFQIGEKLCEDLIMGLTLET